MAASQAFAQPSLPPATELPPPGDVMVPAATMNDFGGPLLVRTQAANLRLVERASRLVELPDNITHVTDFDPNVVAVDPISPTTVRVTATAPGVTTIVFTDVNEVGRSLEVFVAGDTRHLEAHLEYLFPDVAIKAFQVGQNVVLRGVVSKPSQITEIVDVAREFYPQVHNQLQVATNDRVVLHAKVAEVNRSRLRQFGANFAIAGTSGIFNNATGGVGPASAITAANPIFSLLDGTLPNPNLSFAFTASGTQYGAFIEALKQEALLRILAEPSVTVTSGRPGTVLSGGEFPILVPQGLGQTAIEFREFGISIEALCVVLGDGRVRLDISPEVSDLDFANGVTLDGIRIPGLTTRRVNTQAEMRFGETLVLGGLISKRRIGSTSKVPYLGELPVIGAAFSRKRYEEAETELLIMVTPVPAAPYGPGECIPPAPGESSSDPTDCELYWAGMLELPKYGERCANGQCGPGFGAGNVCHDGMICPQGCAPPMQYAPPTGHPVQSMPMESLPMDAAPPQTMPPMPAGEPYMPPATPEQPIDLPPAEIPLTEAATFSSPTFSTPAFNAPEPSTPQVTRPEITQAQVASAPEFRAPVVDRVAYQQTHTAETAVPATTPSRPVSAAGESRFRRPVFNPFATRSSEDGIKAPAPSGPASRETADAGLIAPSDF